MRMNAQLGLLAALTIAATAPGAHAHGGEDHGEAPPPPSAADDVRTATATTSVLELVVRWPMKAATDGPVNLRLLAADFATNAPLEAADIEATFSSPGQPDLVVKAAPTKSPGVYEAEARFPANGTYALSVMVVAGEVVDVLAIPAVEVGPPPAQAHTHAHEEGGSAVGVLIAVGVLAALLLVIAAIWRRRRGRGAAPLASTAVLLMAALAHAHGGEDHGDAAAPATRTAGTNGKVFLAKESQFLLGVRTAVVETRALTDRVQVSGIVTAPPERHAAVFLPQSGRVAPPKGGFPQLGARIKKGQLLGTVEAVLSAPERASFLSEEAKARADASTAAARLDAATRALERLESLKGISSQQQIEAARVDVRAAQSALDDAQARQSAFSTAAGTARIDLLSPLAGILADINVSPGQVLNQGERAFLVVDPTTLTVEAKVPEHSLARLLDTGDAVVSVDAYPGRAFPGRLLAQGQVIEETTRTAKVIFSLDNNAGLLKLGMFARVQIGAGEAEPVVAVPEAAVLDIDGRRVVYVHTGPEEFEAREIAVGTRDGEALEVVRGLEPGERVVVVGAYTLRNAPAR